MATHFAVQLFQRKSEAGTHWRQQRPGRSPMLCEEAGRRASNQDFQRAQQPWWSQITSQEWGVGQGCWTPCSATEGIMLKTQARAQTGTMCLDCSVIAFVTALHGLGPTPNSSTSYFPFPFGRMRPAAVGDLCSFPVGRTQKGYACRLATVSSKAS